MSTPTPSRQRQTRQRIAVATLLQDQSDFLSAQQVHEALRRSGESVGLTTVYRTLAAMADAGDVDVLVSDAGESVYRACGAGHHHHLVCRRCGGAVEIAGPAVEQWADDTARMHGYSEVSHRLEIFGVCPDCQRG